jgi:hypothetical protein
MRAVILTIVVATFLPAAAGAQERAISVADNFTFGSARLDEQTAFAVRASATAAPQVTPVRRGETRRRPSMVGYIDDATITSKVRVRFDAGFHIDAPDRAEFFYAKCGCYRDLSPAHPAFDPEAPGPGPGVVTDLNFQQLYVQGEYAVNGRFSLLAEAPVRWIQPQSFVTGTGSFPNQSGVGDLTLGAKVSLFADDDRDLTVQVRTSLPTGDALKGLGTHHWIVEPMLLYRQRITDRLGFESQVGDWHPMSWSEGIPTSGDQKFASDILVYGFGPSFDVVNSSRLRLAPVVELVGWRILNGFQTGGAQADAGGTNIVNLKAGARAVVRDRHSFYAGYGWALTSAAWYDRVVRLEYRYGF